MKFGLKKVTKKAFRNIFKSYRVKLFNEELIHLHKDEYAECDDKDTELVKVVDVKELSPVFRHCKALERE
jgi:hypothetical protein